MVARALVRAWGSLWNAEAYDEREWYGINQKRAAMAVLVDPGAKDELSSIVAFSGNPTAPGNEWYLVDAQAGELDVVLPDLDVFPEKNLLAMANGVVTVMNRTHESSEIPAGNLVIEEEELEEIGDLLWQILQPYPVAGDVPPSASVLRRAGFNLKKTRGLKISTSAVSGGGIFQLVQCSSKIVTGAIRRCYWWRRLAGLLEAQGPIKARDVRMGSRPGMLPHTETKRKGVGEGARL
jgi:hypothetical protein